MLDIHISYTTLLVWVLVGGLAGWLASLVVHGSGLGLLGNILVGVVGAFLGGLLLSRLLPSVFSATGGFTGFNIGSLVVAFVGSVILLLVVGLFDGRRRTHASTT